MPITKSAIRNLRKSRKNEIHNRSIKHKLKDMLKNIEKLVTNNKKKEAAKLMPETTKAIDLAAKKNLIHRNKAARKKSQLAKMVK